MEWKSRLLCGGGRKGSVVLDQGRLGGRSPLSSSIVTNVAQPGVFSSWSPSAGLRDVATRQRSASSSCLG